MKSIRQDNKIFRMFSGWKSSGSSCDPVKSSRLTAHGSPLTGMTLIELLIVMMIMVIILSISVPAFTSMGRGADMRGAVSSVRATLAQSRQWAITHREPVSFCYGASGKTNYYYVTNAAGLLLQATNFLPLSVRFENSDSVTFKSDGSLAGGSAYVNIKLVSSNATKEIEIAPLTGGIKVQ